MTNQTGTGWQRRKGGRTYFYRTVRLPDGRRVKKYFGRGEEAQTESVKLANEIKRSQRFAVTRRLTAESESLMKRLALQVDSLVSAKLILDGYHNPNGRGWRLNSMSTSHRERKRTKGDVVSDDHANSSPPHRQKRTLEEIVRAAKGGDQSVVAELRAAMENDPSLYAGTSDLANEVQIRWLNRLTPVDLHRRESLRQRINQLKQEFIADGDSRTECLLIDEIISVWLQHQFHEQCNAILEKPDIRVADHYSKRTELSFRRYLKALEALSKYRVLLSRTK